MWLCMWQGNEKMVTHTILSPHGMYIILWGYSCTYRVIPSVFSWGSLQQQQLLAMKATFVKSGLKGIAFTGLANVSSSFYFFKKKKEFCYFSHDLSVAFSYLPANFTPKSLGVKNRLGQTQQTTPFLVDFKLFLECCNMSSNVHSLYRYKNNWWQKWLQSTCISFLTFVQNWELLVPKTLWWC